MDQPAPIDVASQFAFDEFFFSRTDKKGVIQFGNDVFLRVSKRTPETMFGCPHNIIRHPDMPRAVFKIFWTFIESGDLVGAYVKNLASDGSYYWVYAFTFPVRDGYFSVRFKPSTEIHEKIIAVYKKVREFESSRKRNQENLKLSVEMLIDELKFLGFSDYRDYLIQAGIKELVAREKRALGMESSFGPQIHISPYSEISGHVRNAIIELQKSLHSVEGFGSSRRLVFETSVQLEEKFNELNLVSLNMTISAYKFGSSAAGLGVVSKEFSELSNKMKSNVRGLRTFSETLEGLIKRNILDTSVMNALIYMLDCFVREGARKAASRENGFSDIADNIHYFSAIFEESVQGLREAVLGLEKNLNGLASSLAETSNSFTGLEIIRQMGAIESAQNQEIEQVFSHYLREMAEFTSFVKKGVNGIKDEISSLLSGARIIVKAMNVIQSEMAQAFRLVEEHKDALPIVPQARPIFSS